VWYDKNGSSGLAIVTIPSIVITVSPEGPANCSSCHLVSASPGGAVSNGAPTFAAIAGMKSTTVLSLRAFLQTPHDRMPDLHLSRDEIDDLAGYILSLRRR